MHQGEGAASIIAEMKKKQKCEFDAEKPTWKCNLEGNADTLGGNITSHRGIKKPTVPARKKDVRQNVWPSQAHHLIPWQQLKTHVVTQWLTTAPRKGDKILLSNNDYDVDHGKNGKFMPFVSNLPEWDKSDADEKQKLAEYVMRLAGIQLHQGPHSYQPYNVGEDGYKARVDQYLMLIHDNSLSHYGTKTVEGCADCKSKSQGKKRPPRRNIVRFVDKASGALEKDIEKGRIFVSRRAATAVETGGPL